MFWDHPTFWNTLVRPKVTVYFFRDVFEVSTHTRTHTHTHTHIHTQTHTHTHGHTHTMINCTRAECFTPAKSPLTSHLSLSPLTLNSHPHSDSHSHSHPNPGSHSQYDRKSSHSLGYSSTTENHCLSICFGSIPLFRILWYDRKSLFFFRDVFEVCTHTQRPLQHKTPKPTISWKRFRGNSK